MFAPIKKNEKILAISFVMTNQMAIVQMFSVLA